MRLYAILKVLNFSKICGFDMWYQSMVQTLGLDVAQLVSAKQYKINVLTCILFHVKSRKISFF